MAVTERLTAPRWRLAWPLAARLPQTWQQSRPAPWLLGLLVTVLVTAPAWVPVVSPSFSLWQVDDGRLHLRRALFLAQLIKDRNWYPRWMPQEYGGYGYPTLNFYAPGLYYLTIALAALTHQGLYGGMQVATALAAIGVIAGIYALAWQLWRHAPAAFVVAAAVAYGPYVLQANIFLSGSMTHVLGLAAMALLLASCVALWRRTVEGRPSALAWWCVAICTAAVFLSHNAVAAVTAVVAATWLGCLFLWRPSLRALVAATSAAAAGAAAVAFLWVPALLETGLVQIENNQHGNLNYHNHFLAWPGYHREDVWGLQSRAPWTPGFPIDLHLIYPQSLYGPVRLGLWQGVIWAIGLTILLWEAARLLRRRQPVSQHDAASGHATAPAFSADRRLGVLVLGYGLILAIACYSQTFDWALPWWDRLAALRSIQLPSRLLAPAVYALGLALGACFALRLRPHARAWALAALVSLGLAVAGIGNRPARLDPHAAHEVSLATAAADERAQPGTTDSMDEFLPRTAGLTTWFEGEARGFWLYERMFPEASWLGGRVRAWQDEVAVQDVHGRALWTSATVTAGSAGGTVAFHQLAFPGWRAWVDGRLVPLRPAPPIPEQAIQPGFILVDVPPGQHAVAIRFGPDGPRLIGAALSLATLLAGAGWLLWQSSRAGVAAQRAGLAFAGVAVALLVVVSAVRTLLPLWPPGL